MLGIALDRLMPIRIDLWLVMIALLTLGAVIMFRDAIVCSICLAGAILASGVCAA
jgi:hypothetical protein